LERLDPSVRRTLVQEDQNWVGTPLEIAGNNARAIQAHTRYMTLMLMDTALESRASLAAAYAESLIDATMNKHVTQPIACARGCSHCCTTYVSTTLPEVLRLAQGIRGNAAIMGRVTAASMRARTMSQLQREVDRVHCPILQDHACAAYVHRPTVCRAVLSTSLESCIKFFQGQSTAPFTYPDQLGIVRSFIVIIMRAALVMAKLPHQNFELTHALEIALTTENAEARWLAGEPVFAAVAMDRAEDGAAHMTSLVNALVRAVQPTL
jgi:hypothetical protein